MTKRTFIQIEVSPEERKKAHELAKAKQESGISSMVRRWINDGYKRKFGK